MFYLNCWRPEEVTPPPFPPSISQDKAWKKNNNIFIFSSRDPSDPSCGPSQGSRPSLCSPREAVSSRQHPFSVNEGSSAEVAPKPLQTDLPGPAAFRSRLAPNDAGVELRPAANCRETRWEMKQRCVSVGLTVRSWEALRCGKDNRGETIILSSVS